MRVTYLSEQGGDDVQWCLMDGVILQRWGQGHVHQSSDLLQHHVPAAWVVQHFAVLVDLFLQMSQRQMDNPDYTLGFLTNVTHSYEML